MATVARSPSPAAARPCPAMRRSADSNPFKPADCPSQRSSSSKGGGGGCGCHHASSPSPRRRSLSSSFGEKENEPRDHAARTPKPAARSGGPKNFMAPTISAASKAASPRNSTSKVLGERNHDTPHLAPFSPANLAHKPKPDPRRLRLSFDAPPAPAGDDDGAGVEDPVRAERSLRHSFEAPPAPAAWHGPLAGDDDDDAGMEDPVGVRVGVGHQLAAADPVDAEPSRAALYDPKTNYTSPRPRFLHYKPNPRVDIYGHSRAGVRRLEDGFASASASASESSDETDATATTEDDLTEEEQEQAQQNHLPGEQPALAAPSEAAEARVLAPEPAPGSPPPPLLLSSSAPAAVTPEPARVSAPEPRATPPRARALTPEPKPGMRAPAKKRSSLRFLLPVAFVLFMSAASVCVLLQPDSPIMSNTALSRAASSFLSVQESHPVELAAWLKQWSSSSLDSITSYWEALASTSTQEQEYFGPHFAANWSAAAADADNHGAAADFYYSFAEAWPVPPSEEPISSANALTAEPEEESVDDAGVGEKSDASDYYDMVVDELDVGMSEEAPGSSYDVLEEQLKIQDAVSEASSANLIAESEGVAAVVEEESDASDYSKLDVGASEATPGSSNGEEISQDLDTPSEPAELREQDVESEEPDENHGSGKEEGQEPHLGLESDSNLSPSYLDRISKPAAAAGVAIVVVILSAGIAALSMRKKQAQVATSANAPDEQEQAEEAETRSGSASSEGHRLAKGSVAEETERFGDSGFSQYSSSLSSGHGQGRGKAKEEEENVGLEPASKRESMSYSTSSYGSFTTYEKIAAKKRNKDDEAMTPVRRSSRLRSVKSPEAESS
ncbi:unnamed protein product [Triticum turgidum subsp. durum]|uniref:Uncharacterized protein n=1 Tax=Triticum turgidum subsp. durum TaxID=4567 RepID=A0A9R0ST62_TRITD|nr:unnamed protein product [Triticum turgidum subsp. durum]